MGMFTQSQKNAAEEVYEKMKEHLRPKDGLIHVVMVNSFGKWINQFFGCEDKYTSQIDFILTSMQRDGYEIIDIKFNSLKDQGMLGSMEGYHTLIMYR